MKNGAAPHRLRTLPAFNRRRRLFLHLHVGAAVLDVHGVSFEEFVMSGQPDGDVKSGAKPQGASGDSADALWKAAAGCAAGNPALTQALAAVEKDFRLWAGRLLGEVDFNDFGSTMHEKPHCLRVLLLALLEASLSGGAEALSHSLAAAAVFHDARREDDDLDTGHGKRASLYYERFCRERGFTPDAAASKTMAFHDLSDMIGFGAVAADGTLPPHAAECLRFFKDADALDRYRFGASGLDPAYLRTPEARRLMSFAAAINGVQL